jgi:NitT/TauT family transport system permease protein
MPRFALSRSTASSDARALWVSRLVLGVALLVAWELAGHLAMGEWISRPSLIAARLYLLATTDLYIHLATTLAEIILGLIIGVPSGIAVGLWLGRAQLASALLRPVVIAINAIPIVALTPLLIMWFGLGLQPKVALVTLVSFFLLFFNTYSGVVAMDHDLIDALALMGATRREIFQKAILPGCLPWIMSGLKSALPYSLIAAVVGEMLLARDGLGHLVQTAAAQFDMTGIYTALFVLMLLGMIVNVLAARSEAFLLRWRPTS